MAKKTSKKTVEEVVEEVKAEDIPVEVVKEETKGKKLFLHESGQMGHMDEDNNFVPAN